MVDAGRARWYRSDMSKRFPSLAVATIALSVLAQGATGAAAAGDSRHPYETCLTASALALEPGGTAVSEVVAEAERTCSGKKGQLSSSATSELSQKARLAVIQQRSNARNLERRF
jgi:hypothetical protein